MRMIESDKVIPLMRLLLLFNPKADAICKDMQEVVDIHTIDAVPVVRCKDCKHWKPSGSEAGSCFENLEPIGGCRWVNFCRKASDFCSYGERKDGDG